MRAEANSADGEAAASDPEHPASIIMKVAAPNIPSATEQPSEGRRCHLGLSELEISQCQASKFQRTG